jgi:uncharacterized protein (UPF0332 family)
VNAEVSARLAKADAYLGSVVSNADTDVPETVVSTAYYAMYHAAAAVVLTRTGDIPKTHSQPIGLFGQIVRTLGDAARGMGRSLNEAYDRRVAGDYSSALTMLRSDALRARDAAVAFVTFCKSLLAGPATGP